MLFMEVEHHQHVYLRKLGFTSFYPFVQKSKKFSTGPQIYIKDECQQIDIKTMFGLVNV